MRLNLFIFGLSLVLFAETGFAQDKIIVPPSLPVFEDYILVIPELQVDSIFMQQLDSILFSAISKWRSQGYFSGLESNRNFSVHFQYKIPSRYFIYVELQDTPPRKAIGYLQREEYLYFFDGDIPPDIISEKRAKRRFSFKKFSRIYDPPFWDLKYDRKAEIMQVVLENWQR